jgi:MFS family permease
LIHAFAAFFHKKNMTTSSTALRNSVVAALGGFLFGFDTAVISGVEKTIQQLWALDEFWHGFTMASALIGTVIGSVIAGKPAEVYGRKKNTSGHRVTLSRYFIGLCLNGFLAFVCFISFPGGHWCRSVIGSGSYVYIRNFTGT